MTLHDAFCVVLVAEDEVLIQNVVRMVLEREGYAVLTASDGVEALAISRRYPGVIHALITDVRMPRVDGIELADRIRKERPSTKILVISAETSTHSMEVLQSLLNAEFLRKPFLPSILRDKVNQLLAGDCVRAA